MAKEKQNRPVGVQFGKSKPFGSSKVASPLLQSPRLVDLDYKFIFGLTAAALLLRTYKIHQPPQVVFDEVNFGSFVKNYHDGKFFIDVHPPLVKLIYYYMAVHSGWDGEYNFAKIGDVYDINTPYLVMRLFPAIYGALTVPVTFLALRGSCCRTMVAAFGAVLVLFENSLATVSRFIMLDAPLVYFTGLSVMSFQFFQACRPFSRSWHLYLLSTGVSIGLAVSTKLTGLFTLVWVGLWSAFHLWTILGDMNISLSAVMYHAVARFAAFLILPLTIYLRLFALHFELLSKNGPGSGAVSPAFKSEFEDSAHLNGYAAEVSYGSIVTLRHSRLNTYLHSHKYTYKHGSQQQQVTMYGFSGDGNSEWIIEKTGTNFEGKFKDQFRPIYNGDSVKLLHKLTGKYLRANDVRPPNSEHDYSNEVSCNGNRTDTQHSDYEWTVVIVDKAAHADDSAKSQLKATQSIFKLHHRGTRCTLMGQNVFLPDWAFHQNQVLCMNDPTETNVNWYIEMNLHPVIDGDHKTYPRVKLPKLLFFQKVKEYHEAMWRVNKGFVKKHAFASLPYSWLFPVRGIAFFSNGHGSKNFTDEPGSHIYMLGNVIVYSAGLVVMVIFVLRFGFYLLKHLNPFEVPTERAHVTVYYIKSLQYVSGWFLQFYPFLYQERKLFAHHYLSSVYFLILATAQFAEYQMAVCPKAGKVFMATIATGTIYVFWTLLPVVVGSGWTVEKCEAAKWLPSWDFDCAAYADDL